MSKNETPREFVERVWGKCTIKEMDGLLWHCTAFPCIDVPELEKQLRKVKLDSGGIYDVAMNQAEDKINQAIQGLKNDNISD